MKIRTGIQIKICEMLKNKGIDMKTEIATEYGVVNAGTFASKASWEYSKAHKDETELEEYVTSRIYL